ncbi:MAG: tagaturonate reductase [Elusimicrobiota bacterium]|jgi:tagaturonate reductase|nr:tagaturonate reductase [Elusimicrobiota bacterium]
MKMINEVVRKVWGNYPEKVLQIGDGNFLRAFVDWMIDEANEKGVYKGSVVVCSPLTGGKVDTLNAQNGIYTLVAQGLKNGKPTRVYRQITSISRALKIKNDFEAFLKIAQNPDLEIVVSNTTEAGIVYLPQNSATNNYPETFPAKMAMFLHKRYLSFNGDRNKGLIFLPCELNERNGELLKKCILQYSKDLKYEKDFFDWVENVNTFANTLVDRIVAGYPKDKEEIASFQKELGYQDDLLVVSESYNSWIIEGAKNLMQRLPLDKTSANIKQVDDISKYNTMKVRLLNGAHTALTPAAILDGSLFVLDAMGVEIFNDYLRAVFDEIIPSLDLPQKDLRAFAANVIERFKNPYLKHSLLDISLNSCAKFNTRCLPSILEYCKQKSRPPKFLSFAFAAFIKFYQGKMIDGVYQGTRENGQKYQIKDGAKVIEFFNDLWAKNPSAETAVRAVLSNKSFWGDKDLTLVDGLAKTISISLEQINATSIKQTLNNLL